MTATPADVRALRDMYRADRADMDARYAIAYDAARAVRDAADADARRSLDGRYGDLAALAAHWDAWCAARAAFEATAATLSRDLDRQRRELARTVRELLPEDLAGRILDDVYYTRLSPLPTSIVAILREHGVDDGDVVTVHDPELAQAAWRAVLAPGVRWEAGALSDVVLQDGALTWTCTSGSVLVSGAGPVQAVSMSGLEYDRAVLRDAA